MEHTGFINMTRSKMDESDFLSSVNPNAGPSRVQKADGPILTAIYTKKLICCNKEVLDTSLSKLF